MLVNCIIEFEIGSVMFMFKGCVILDEMVVVLLCLNGCKIEIVGYIDNFGSCVLNFNLS